MRAGGSLYTVKKRITGEIVFEDYTAEQAAEHFKINVCSWYPKVTKSQNGKGDFEITVKKIVNEYTVYDRFTESVLYSGLEIDEVSEVTGIKRDGIYKIIASGEKGRGKYIILSTDLVNKGKETKKCEFCQKEYKGTEKSRFCSKKCYQAAYRKTKNEMIRNAKVCSRNEMNFFYNPRRKARKGYLDKCVKRAEELGLSYGKYMAYKRMGMISEE